MRFTRESNGIAGASGMIKLKLKGQLPSGKNRIKERFINGKKVRYPDARFKAWRADATRQVLSQAPLPFRTFTLPCVLRVNYWAGDLIRRDVSGMLDALFHLFEHAPTEQAPIVADDFLLRNVGWRYMDLDRANPRVEVEIEEVQ